MLHIEKAGGREIKGRLGTGQDGGRQSTDRGWIGALEST